MANPFTDQSREVRWEVGAKGFCDQLRAPEALDFLRHVAKPGNESVGDWVLTSTLNEYLTREIEARNYDAVVSALVGLFGESLTVVRNGMVARKPLTAVRAADKRQDEAAR